MRVSILLLASLVFVASAPVAAGPRLSGDLRFGVLASERLDRDGRESSDDEWRSRVRVALDATPAQGWRTRVRVAGRFGPGADGLHVYLRHAAPSASGARSGDVTLDEAYLERDTGPSGWWMRVGRFQSRFDLHGVASKSLDRNDSPNMDVNWTDGLHLRYDRLPGWRLHMLWEHNAARHPGAVRRPPLDFTGDSAGPAVFIGLEGVPGEGRWIQRMVAVTWMPDALAQSGPGYPARRDYWTLTTRAALALVRWDQGGRLSLGGELGHAPRTQAQGAQGAGRAGGLAWQASLNLESFVPGHSLGLVHGRVDSGWLISPDFRNNERLTELRYQWRLTPAWSIEARLREREELVAPAPALRSRRDRDAYLRLSGRFGGR